ncbi:MAG: retroviral-like aspartic protease family protein [Deltaproteobacteria bacterium]|nr:retroviral-like aspartic protease family protein [Deltaproteobacteria bacterium]
MLWRTSPTSAMRLRVFCLWHGVAGLFLLLSLGREPLWAQSAIYSWTDEKGITHYSDSMIPTQHLDRAAAVIMPSRSTPGTSGSGESESIPLVILNDDPSQKFVRAVLGGESLSREVLMLVDTGAQITVIDEALAQDLDVEHVQDALLAGVTGVARGWIGRLATLRVGGEEVSDLNVMVGPMPGRLLLGMDVLERLELSVGPHSLHRNR